MQLWLAFLSAALALFACGGASYMSYEVTQYRATLMDDPAFQCCKANAMNMCAGVADTACDDNGTCYCCPNGGGITANFTDGVQCTCGNKQSCADVKCKGKECVACEGLGCGCGGLSFVSLLSLFACRCGPTGQCVSGYCKCDYLWSGPDCTISMVCCTTPYNATQPTLCQSNNTLVAGVCKGSECYCCPYPAIGPINAPMFNTDNQCKCRIHVAQCVDPGPPPCSLIHCGLHATCVTSQGVCRCDKGWTNLNPATNSCLTERELTRNMMLAPVFG
jgi:hypothetical protein